MDFWIWRIGYRLDRFCLCYCCGIMFVSVWWWFLDWVVGWGDRLLLVFCCWCGYSGDCVDRVLDWWWRLDCFWVSGFVWLVFCCFCCFSGVFSFYWFSRCRRGSLVGWDGLVIVVLVFLLVVCCWISINKSRSCWCYRVWLVWFGVFVFEDWLGCNSWCLVVYVVGNGWGIWVLWVVYWFIW